MTIKAWTFYQSLIFPAGPFVLSQVEDVFSWSSRRFRQSKAYSNQPATERPPLSATEPVLSSPRLNLLYQQRLLYSKLDLEAQPLIVLFYSIAADSSCERLYRTMS